MLARARSTPLAAASQVLKAVGPSTVVAVQSNVYVAGRAAYQLALAPRSSKSLVGQVLIAIDASRHIPLRVEVFGRGSAGLVYSVGFTSLTFGTPAASNFSFTPPPGATVKKQTVPGNFKSLLEAGGPWPGRAWPRQPRPRDSAAEHTRLASMREAAWSCLATRSRSRRSPQIKARFAQEPAGRA